MTVIYFNTVKRKRPVKDAGDMVLLNWDSKKILKTIPIYPFDPDIADDPNPRGNSRGGKGIFISGDEIFTGTYHSILVFDPDLNLKRKLTHHLFVNIHEMCAAGENIWVSSTAIDAALLVDRQGRALKTWWPREERLLQERYGLHPMDIDKRKDNRLVYLHSSPSTGAHHTHLNSVFNSGGDTYVLLNKVGSVVQIEPEVRVILEHPWLRGAHSPVISGDGQRLLLCSSFQRSILVYDLKERRMVKKIDLLNFTESADLYRQHPDQPYNQSIFVRGLEIIDERRILAGISPASILEVDVQSGRLVDYYRHSDDVGDAVHGLACLTRAEI